MEYRDGEARIYVVPEHCQSSPTPASAGANTQRRRASCTDSLSDGCDRARFMASRQTAAGDGNMTNVNWTPLTADAGRSALSSIGIVGDRKVWPPLDAVNWDARLIPGVAREKCVVRLIVTSAGPVIVRPDGVFRDLALEYCDVATTRFGTQGFLLLAYFDEGFTLSGQRDHMTTAARTMVSLGMGQLKGRAKGRRVAATGGPGWANDLRPSREHPNLPLLLSMMVIGRKTKQSTGEPGSEGSHGVRATPEFDAISTDRLIQAFTSATTPEADLEHVLDAALASLGFAPDLRPMVRE